MAKLDVRNLGDYIREQRSSANVSLRQLAKLAGVSNPYLSQIERGLRKPSAEILQQIARGLRISAEALYVQAGILDERIAGTEVSEAVMADLPPETPTRDAAIDVLWSMFQGPAFTAWLELSLAARTEPDLAADVERVDTEFSQTSVELFRELFPEDTAADPELPRIAVATLFTFLTGLALSRAVPGCQLIAPEDLLDVFKLLIASTLPTPEETP